MYRETVILPQRSGLVMDMGSMNISRCGETMDSAAPSDFFDHLSLQNNSDHTKCLRRHNSDYTRESSLQGNANTHSISEPISIPTKKTKGKKSRSHKSTPKSFQRCENHPLDESDEDEIFDESFDRSSLSSVSSSSSFVALKSNAFTSITNTTVEGTSFTNGLSFPKISIKKLTTPSKLSSSKMLPSKHTASSSLSRFQLNAGDVHKGRGDVSKRDREVPMAIELTTFNQLAVPTFDSYPSKTFKHRDERINNRFLKLYAMDLSCRKLGYLPNNSTDIDPQQFEMHRKFNLFTLSTQSRDKLWQNIILPPREDDTPLNSIEHNGYVHIHQQEQSSVIMKNGDYLPWNSGVKSWKPCGKLPSGRQMVNGENPNSGVTATQYTVKGWCNSKWV